ncbi:MAG: ERCC4 domain-containing protein [Nanoarchaeota archaeon]
MTNFLNIFSKNKIPKTKKTIIVDNRESNSLVPTELKRLGFNIEFQQLPVADYLINNIAIERKTISDFKSSIISKRIISQLNEIKQYPRHILIVEGIESEDIYSGQIHENAFRGMILAIATEFKVPLVFTKNEKDTAKYIAVLANKKQKSEQPIRASKILLSEKEQIQFILEGFPNIGPASAKKLIEHFKTIKNITNASKEDLEEIIGKKAEEIYNIINKEI